MNAETFEESAIESCQIRIQENTQENLVLENLQSISLNYKEKPPSSKMENTKALFVSNCLVEEQHTKIEPHFFHDL